MERDEVILLDTHAAIWFATRSDHLGKKSRAVANQALADEQLLMSAISFWEIALLASKRRLRIDISPSELREQLLNGGVTELPLTGAIAIRAVDLTSLHGDPSDRFIMATAIVHGATLMTADTALLEWQHPIQRQDAST
jgi:PIN domain nuclease of toxin-antitoxin system